MKKFFLFLLALGIASAQDTQPGFPPCKMGTAPVAAGCPMVAGERMVITPSDTWIPGVMSFSALRGRVEQIKCSVPPNTELVVGPGGIRAKTCCNPFTPLGWEIPAEEPPAAEPTEPKEATLHVDGIPSELKLKVEGMPERMVVRVDGRVDVVHSGSVEQVHRGSVTMNPGEKTPGWFSRHWKPVVGAIGIGGSGYAAYRFWPRGHRGPQALLGPVF